MSDDMCMTFYTYGDEGEQLTQQDVKYYRKAHEQLRQAWEAAMGGGFSG